MHVFAGGYQEPGARGLCRLTITGEGLEAGPNLAAYANVSAGIRRPGTGLWYLVDEEADRVTLADADTDWREVASFSSGGHGPCHLALDRSGRLLSIANYGSGTVAMYRLDGEGLPVGPPAIHQNEGQGPNVERQEGPHAHWVGFAPDGRLYAADLGTDQILAFPTHAPTGALGEPSVAYAAPPGSGPRQLAFHPILPVAFLVSELASTLTVLKIEESGTLSVQHILSTLPADAAPDSLGGAVALNPAGTRLYVSNRGHDSVASFAVDPEGEVRLLGHTPSGGTSPRFLLLLEDKLLVAHEKAGGVTILPLDGTGRPGPSAGQAELPGAAFLGASWP
ncbi:6-phosphogluconolactonase [Sphingomonas desiccabilis]|nr:6-phosphogluconolactonase [Sphingomonas desiccabilis]